jgi:hypothetical protein
LSQHKAFSSARRQHCDRVVTAVSEVLVNRVNGGLLVRSQLHFFPPAR